MIIRINNQQSTIDNPQSAKGFSLTEVLIAIGLLAVGMLFIAGSFPVSIHLTTVATERTIAPTVADEAFAKVMLWAGDPNYPLYAADYQNFIPPYSFVFEERANLKRTTFFATVPISFLEFAYPSTITSEPYSRQYWWSAICRKVDLNPLSQDVQVTVFVSRKVGTLASYYGYDSIRPNAFYVPVTLNAGDLQITNIADRNKINDGYTIVDDATGQIYRVLERYGPNLDLLRLNEAWKGGIVNIGVWVVPPSINSSRYPCIGVYQKIMRF
jgi:prepilin-type N-terminal cleavage/methylation domain-containing protein